MITRIMLGVLVFIIFTEVNLFNLCNTIYIIQGNFMFYNFFLLRQSYLDSEQYKPWSDATECLIWVYTVC